MTSAERNDVLHLVAGAAVDCENATGVPAEITAAQAILESGWLNRAPGFNCFGIKYHQGVVGRQLLDTTEWFTEREAKVFLAADMGRTLVKYQPEIRNALGRSKYKAKDWFAKYRSMADAFRDHARVLMMTPYRDAWAIYDQTHDLDLFIDHLSARYSTDTGYAKTIKQLAHDHNLSVAIIQARTNVANLGVRT